MTQDEVNREWKRLRNRVRKAFRLKKWREVVDGANVFEQFCEDNGWPDWWSDVARMSEDAQWKLRGQVPTMGFEV
jgi:hypothetical protein